MAKLMMKKSKFEDSDEQHELEAVDISDSIMTFSNSILGFCKLKLS